MINAAQEFLHGSLRLDIAPSSDLSPTFCGDSVPLSPAPQLSPRTERGMEPLLEALQSPAETRHYYVLFVILGYLSKAHIEFPTDYQLLRRLPPKNLWGPGYAEGEEQGS